MKKIVLFLLLSFLICYFFISNKNLCKNKDAQIYKLDNKNYCLLTASNQTEWKEGLMFYKSKKELKGADGMIFIFPDKEIRSFWNKNTYLDLNLYWMDDDKVVGKSVLPSISRSKEVVTVSSDKEVNRVIEIINN